MYSIKVMAKTKAQVFHSAAQVNTYELQQWLRPIWDVVGGQVAEKMSSKSDYGGFLAA